MTPLPPRLYTSSPPPVRLSVDLLSQDSFSSPGLFPELVSLPRVTDSRRSLLSPPPGDMTCGPRWVLRSSLGRRRCRTGRGPRMVPRHSKGGERVYPLTQFLGGSVQSTRSYDVPSDESREVRVEETQGLCTFLCLLGGLRVKSTSDSSSS